MAGVWLCLFLCVLFGNGIRTVTCRSCSRMTFSKVYEQFVRLHYTLITDKVTRN